MDVYLVSKMLKLLNVEIIVLSCYLYEYYYKTDLKSGLIYYQ